MAPNNPINKLQVKAINRNLAIADAAIQLQLPPPWSQYWMDNNYKNAINAITTDFCSWTVMIDTKRILEIQRENDK